VLQKNLKFSLETVFANIVDVLTYIVTVSLSMLRIVQTVVVAVFF